MIQEVNSGAPMSPITGIARGTRRDLYMIQPSRKALRAGTPVPSTKVQLRTVTSVCCTVTSSEASAPGRARLLQGHDRQDADDADHEDRAFEQPRADEADREALVLALDDGVERDRGADGGEAVDDVEERAEADLGVGPALPMMKLGSFRTGPCRKTAGIELMNVSR